MADIPDTQHTDMDEIDYHAAVLICIINRPKDLALVREQGWYRIPMLHAPSHLAHDYLAFYQTAAFGAERWAIRYLAAVQQVQLATRSALLPDEANHPRAAERYYQFRLGRLWQLPVALASRRLRRITFIATSYGQLLRARDVNELWHPPEARTSPAEVWGAGVGRRSL